MLRLGIDGRPLQGMLSGTGKYVLELCRQFDAQLSDACFFVYSQHPVTKPVESERWIYRQEPSRILKQLRSALWLKTVAGRLAKDDRLDLYWGSVSFKPRIRRGVRFLVTVHDVTHLVVPYTMTWTSLATYRLFFRRDLKQASAVTTNSQATADRLRDLFHVEADAVIRPSCSREFRPVPPEAQEEVLSRYRIDYPFYLILGTLEPRKNTITAIRAFLNLRDRSEFQAHKLVVVGQAGWKNRAVFKSFRESGKEIAFIGYVPDGDLPALYSACEAFLFPSLYEGFGMPVLEACACGARVVTTDIPELREASGGHAIYVQPTVDDVKNGILHVHEQSLRRHEDFESWEVGAKRLSEVIRSIEGMVPDQKSPCV